MTLSALMNAGLSSLLDINYQMTSVQSVLTTGKKDEATNAGAYNLASGYSARASLLSGVNDMITQNISSYKAASAGLKTIKSAMTDVLTQLRSAENTGTTATGSTADPMRQAAVDAYFKLFDTIDKTVADAAVNGSNLLNGSTLTTSLNEKGTTSAFVISQSSMNATAPTGTAQTFTSLGLGIANAVGSAVLAVGSTASTQAALTTSANASNTDLDKIIAILTTAMSTVDAGTAKVNIGQNYLQSRNDFNKSLMSLLTDTSTQLTAADTTQAAAQFAALQVQQSYANSILSSTKQADLSVIQLLR